MKASDALAGFIADLGCTHVFTVSGAGNIRMLDAIHRLGKTEIISTHHEQAAAMAAIGYYRASGEIAPVIVTCGGGAANVVTGIVSAWMDSIPLFVLAGQESRRNDKLRAYGVQGFNLSRMVHGFTDYGTKESAVVKDADLIETSDRIEFRLESCWDRMLQDRFGPVVIEVPMDVQGYAV